MTGDLHFMRGQISQGLNWDQHSAQVHHWQHTLVLQDGTWHSNEFPVDSDDAGPRTTLEELWSMTRKEVNNKYKVFGLII